jgi:N-acetylglucosamine malate deacetylase 2
MAQLATTSALRPALLDAIADPERRRIAARDVAVVVAHPDDETVGCGALLARMDEARLVLVTDGAPRNLADARAHGFANASAYAAARRRELATALEAAGAMARKLIVLGIPDQQAARQLPALSRRLADLFRREAIAEVLTHAYEGGHPDHDATAFAVHAAARLLAREGRRLSVLEMPFYRLGPEGMLAQSIAGPADDAVVTELTEEERARKQRMMQAHATQQGVLAAFGTDAERFRPAPNYDFTVLPNEGALYYAGRDWGLTGEEWQRCTRAALAELGMTP